jgi:hypothetical protein
MNALRTESGVGEGRGRRQVCGSELADVEVELERLGWTGKLVSETQRSDGGASSSVVVLCPGGTTLSVLDGASMYLLKNPKRVDEKTGQPFVVSGVLTDRARARLVVHQQHAQHLYQAAVWVYVARMGKLGLLRGKDRLIYSQATPADFPSLVVIHEQVAGTLSLYAAYQHGTFRSPSAMTAEEFVAAVYALVLQTWSGRCTTCTFVLLRPKTPALSCHFSPRLLR